MPTFVAKIGPSGVSVRSTNPRVRIWQKKKIVVDRLGFKQFQMLKLGTVGVAAVKQRVQAGLGPEDAAAKGLTRRYAIRKSMLRLGNTRNLTFTGQMLNNLQVRTVSEKEARAGLSTRIDRIKAQANQNIEPWLVFSPRNQDAVKQAAKQIFAENARNLIR